VVSAADRPDPRPALGAVVRALRIRRGLTQEGLAEASSLHPRYISDVERGRRNVGLINLDRLAAALGVDLATLMTEVEAARR
jgi:transcriptional regulator with XRE-family HTH domain